MAFTSQHIDFLSCELFKLDHAGGFAVHVSHALMRRLMNVISSGHFQKAAPCVCIFCAL